MFERRLRVFLLVAFFLISLLLIRAAQLQVFGKAQWTADAQAFSQRRHLLETTRGKILDVRGRELAVDEPCIDACVEFGAISKDPLWVRDFALRRLATTQPGVYRKADGDARRIILAGAEAKVIEDIDRIWAALARASAQPVEKVEDSRQAIQQRVLLRTRWLQYKKFQSAKTATASPSSRPSLLERVLTAGASDELAIDHFEFESEEQRRAHVVVRNISPEAYTQLARDIDNYPGLVLRQGAVRRYPYGKAGCHLLGNVVVVQGSDLQDPQNQAMDDLREYLATDLIGHGGIEQLAEPTLRGTRGYVQYPAGRRDEILREQKPLPSQDVQTTIDIELQAEIQSFFEHAKVISNKKDDERTVQVPMHGAAVVLDIKTNEVRALASYPDFDPNKLTEEYEAMATDFQNGAMLNRATHAQLEPGSTVKPIVGLGAITQGFWTTTGGIECTGYLVISQQKQPNGKCWTAAWQGQAGLDISHHSFPVPHHGSFGNPDGFLTFTEALERSCNVYFETLADKMGPAALSHWFDKFGLGHETGLGLREATGHIIQPTDIYPRSLTWFSAIGQSRVRATPIQMANVVATIARNGVWMRPRLIRGNPKLAPVPLWDGRVLPDREDLKLSPEAVQAAREGMTRVVNSPAGTGKPARMDVVVLAGKTGTAQAHPRFELDSKGDPVKKPGKDGILGTDDDEMVQLPRATIDTKTKTPWYRGWGEDGSKLNHAWFVGFAPADDPQVAIAVLVEYGGSGGTCAGAIAKQTLTACAERGYLTFKKVH